MKELLPIEDRLENWAAAQRSNGPRGPDIGSVEGRYRKHAPEPSEAPAVDLADAALVNAAWRQCLPFDKELLRMHYVWRAHSDFVCRRLKIKNRPLSVWDLALAHAHRAISGRLAVIEGLPPVKTCAYNPPQLIIDPALAE